MRTALIGAGQIARQHLACLKELKEVRVVAVCDLSPARAESTADRFGVPTWYSDYHRMFEEAKPDVVHITTPPSAHFQIAMDALVSGSHVFVEKPITLRHEDFLKLKQCAEERRRFLMEDHNYLFNSSIQQVLQYVHSGEMGDIVHVEIFFSVHLGTSTALHSNPPLPKGPISDFLPHMAYLTYAFIGSPFYVKTMWAKRQGQSLAVDDEFRALIGCVRGTATLGFSANAQPNLFGVRIYGTKMRVDMNLLEPVLLKDRVRSVPRPLVPFFNGLKQSVDLGKGAIKGFWERLGGQPGPYEGMWKLIAKTYAALEAGEEQPIPMEQIDAANRLFQDLIESEDTI